MSFVICFRWVHDLLEVHEDFIGLYEVNNIKAETLAEAVENVLLILLIQLENARRLVT